MPASHEGVQGFGPDHKPLGASREGLPRPMIDALTRVDIACRYRGCGESFHDTGFLAGLLLNIQGRLTHKRPPKGCRFPEELQLASAPPS